LLVYNQGGGGTFICTGWFIGKNTLATAGHCVHNGVNTWSTNMKVYPGRNGASSPFGSCSVKRLHSVNGWVNGGDERYDYGAIRLSNACTNIGNTTGWYGFMTAKAIGNVTQINGYPGDKPSGTQWRSFDTVRAQQARQTFYRNDTFGGMSGSPVYRPSGGGCTPCGHTIHAYGLHGAPPHSTNNHGTKIITAVFNNLLTWKNLP
jgi:glutamyl endopeptidase